MLHILGLDGLDHDLVLRWKLENLKQKYYGKIAVPIDPKYHKALTPSVWACFLTGRMVKADFIDMGEVYMPRRLVTLFFNFLEGAKRLGFGFGLAYKSAIIVARIWKEAHPKNVPKLKWKTFIDEPYVSEINSIFYSYDHKPLLLLNSFFRSYTIEETVSKLMSIYEHRKKLITQMTKKAKTKVVFAFLHFPDTLSHLLWLRPNRLRIHYEDLNMFVGKLQQILQDSMFIIVSDHGFDLEKGTHSKHGFYSSNKILKRKPTKITDFYRIVLEYDG